MVMDGDEARREGEGQADAGQGTTAGGVLETSAGEACGESGGTEQACREQSCAACGW